MKMDLKRKGEEIVEGAKKVPSATTLWTVAGATFGLLIGVMAMSAWFQDKPSLTTVVLPMAPVPGYIAPQVAQETTVAETTATNGGAF